MSSRYSNLFVSVSTFILTLLVVMPFSVYSQKNEATEDSKDIVATAKQDAKNNESTFTWMLGGCCLIGTGMAYVAKPTPPKTDLSDKSAEYIEIYEQAFSQQLFTMARSMGIDNQDQLLILSDGARWINKLAQTLSKSDNLILWIGGI